MYAAVLSFSELPKFLYVVAIVSHMIFQLYHVITASCVSTNPVKNDYVLWPPSHSRFNIKFLFSISKNKCIQGTVLLLCKE